MPLLNTADALYLGDQVVDRVYLGVTQVWPPVPETYVDVVLADNPLGYWPLTEPFGSVVMLDASGNGRNGVIDGTVTCGAPGLLAGGTCWALNAADEGGEVAAASWMAPAAALTAEAWIYLTGYDTDGTVVICRAAVSGANTQGLKAWSIQVSSGGAVLGRVFNDAGTTVVPISANGVVPLNTLCHLVIVQTGTEVRYYRNGVSVASAALVGAPVSFIKNTQPLTVGQTHGTGALSYSFNGRIAHAAFYGTALSSARIQAHYEAGT